MERTLIITDVTRMKSQRVCVAGITEDGETIRPTLPNPGVQEAWLYSETKVIIRPFARVIFDLIKHKPQRPHTEDCEVSQDYRWLPGLLDIPQRLGFLKGIAEETVHDIFGAPIQHVGNGYFVQQGEGWRSLATLHVRTVEFVGLCEEHNGLNHKIIFSDWENQVYKLTVTDLSFRYFVDHLHTGQSKDFRDVNIFLKKLFSQADTYIRLGLARGYNPNKQEPQDRCYLQVTGVYTFPDYLDQKCFADYSSH